MGGPISGIMRPPATREGDLDVKHHTDIPRRTLLGATLGTAVLVASTACGRTSSGGGSQSAKAGGTASWQPTRPVTVVAPFSAGGSTGVMTRAIAAGVEEVRPKVQARAEYRAGGGGAVGYTYVFQQSDDPHCLVAASPSMIGLPLTGDMPWSVQDFTGIAIFAEDPMVLFARAQAKFHTLQELVELSGRSEVLAGTAGAVGVDAATLRVVQEATGLNIKVVPYDGGDEVLVALLSGDVDIAAGNIGDYVGQLEAKKVVALATLAERRFEDPAFSHILTAKQQEIDAVFTQWRAVFAPPGITKKQQEYWTQAIRDWADTDTYKEYVSTYYKTPVMITGKAMEQYMAQQTKVYSRLV